MNFKKSVFLLLFIMVCYFSNAQLNTIDSLKKLVNKSEPDSGKVKSLIELSKAYFTAQPNDAFKTCREAKKLAEEINYQPGLALTYKTIGIFYYRQAIYLDAINNWQQAIDIYTKIGDKKGVSNILNNLGAIYFDQADDEKALGYYLQSLKIAEEINDSSRTMTALANVGGMYGKKKQTYDKAITYDKRALAYAELLNDLDAIGTASANLGEVYRDSNNDSLALIYFERSMNAYKNTDDAPFPLYSLGTIYTRKGDFAKAIEYQTEALKIATKNDDILYIIKSQLSLADTYKEKGDYKLALAGYKEVEELCIKTGSDEELKKTYEGLAAVYSKLSDFDNAYKYQSLLITLNTKLYDIATGKKLNSMLFDSEIEKKELRINSLTKDQQLKDKEISRQKLVRNGFIGGFAVVLLFAGVFLSQRNKISKEKKRSDELLLNILPEETAEELKETGKAKVKSYKAVTVMFTDFKNFTQASEKLTPEELVEEINFCYSEFDKIITKYGIEKIKTIGDSYMCAGGLPMTNATHPFDVIKAGLELQQFIEKNKAERIQQGLPFFELRLGIHTGPVVAGIVGIKKFAYDIWGDAVNLASRMESSGEVGMVNISQATFEHVKDHFECTPRGKVYAKNKGDVDMYFVLGHKIK